VKAYTNTHQVSKTCVGHVVRPCESCRRPPLRKGLAGAGRRARWVGKGRSAPRDGKISCAELHGHTRAVEQRGEGDGVRTVACRLAVPRRRASLPGRGGRRARRGQDPLLLTCAGESADPNRSRGAHVRPRRDGGAPALPPLSVGGRFGASPRRSPAPLRPMVLITLPIMDEPASFRCRRGPMHACRSEWSEGGGGSVSPPPRSFACAVVRFDQACALFTLLPPSRRESLASIHAPVPPRGPSSQLMDHGVRPMIIHHIHIDKHISDGLSTL